MIFLDQVCLGDCHLSAILAFKVEFLQLNQGFEASDFQIGDFRGFLEVILAIFRHKQEH
nr:MAG TPA: hypothetical protein [Caudoviricetes sp.]